MTWVGTIYIDNAIYHRPDLWDAWLLRVARRTLVLHFTCKVHFVYFCVPAMYQNIIVNYCRLLYHIINSDTLIMKIGDDVDTNVWNNITESWEQCFSHCNSLCLFLKWALRFDKTFLIVPPPKCHRCLSYKLHVADLSQTWCNTPTLLTFSLKIDHENKSEFFQQVISSAKSILLFKPAVRCSGLQALDSCNRTNSDWLKDVPKNLFPCWMNTNLIF